MSSPIAALHDELLVVVFSFVGQGVLVARCVCRAWRTLADDVLVGRHIALYLPPNHVPVASPGLSGAVIIRSGCQSAVVAAIVQRYQRLRGLVLMWPADDDVAVEPPASLRHVNLTVSRERGTMRLMSLARYAESLMIGCDTGAFLRIPNAARLRAIDARIDDCGHDGCLELLRAMVQSMTSLRFIRLHLGTIPGHAWKAFVDALPDTVDHVDTSALTTELERALPAGIRSVDSEIVDPRCYPLLRVLATTRSPHESFASLHALALQAWWDEEFAPALATLTQLRLLSVDVEPSTVPSLFRALTGLPFLLVLDLVFLIARGMVPRWRMRTNRSRMPPLSHLRRLAVANPPPTLTLPPLPAIEVIVVRFGMHASRWSFWYCAPYRTPWTADERDAILRCQMLSVDCNVSMASEHDPLCMFHHAAPNDDEHDSPRSTCRLPLVAVERYRRLYCSCQLLTY
jgi:hypothetical protein